MKLITILFFVYLTLANDIFSSILLKDIKSLTLRKNHFTSGRRSNGVPQLNCIGGTAISQCDKVDMVQCYNMGFDGKDYTWKCESILDDKLKLGKTEVSCEGYQYPDDPYVLVGSCGVEFYLEYTDKYYQQQTHRSNIIIDTSENKKLDNEGSDFLLKLIFVPSVIVIGIILFVFYIDCPSSKNKCSETKYMQPKYRQTKYRQPQIISTENSEHLFVEPSAPPPAQSIEQPIVQPYVQPIIQPIVQPYVQPIIQPIVQQFVQPFVQPIIIHEETQPIIVHEKIKHVVSNEIDNTHKSTSFGTTKRR